MVDRKVSEFRQQSQAYPSDGRQAEEAELELRELKSAGMRHLVEQSLVIASC